MRYKRRGELEKEENDDYLLDAGQLCYDPKEIYGLDGCRKGFGIRKLVHCMTSSWV